MVPARSTGFGLCTSATPTAVRGEPLVGSDRWSRGGVPLGCRLVVAGFLNLVCGRPADHSALGG
jgi:hypothetical protein